MSRCSACSDVGVLLDCHGEAGAKPEGEALNWSMFQLSPMVMSSGNWQKEGDHGYKKANLVSFAGSLGSPPGTRWRAQICRGSSEQNLVGTSNWRRPQGRHRTRWRDYISNPAWERLRIPPEELEDVGKKNIKANVVNLISRPRPELVEENAKE